MSLFNRFALVLLALAAGCALPAMSLADDLPEAAEAAKEAFEPLSSEDLDAARSRLAERVVAVERLLNPSTQFGARWLDFLAWEGVQKQLAPDAEPDLAAARETLRRLGSGADGLEKPQLQSVAQALEDYIVVASFAPAPADRQEKSFDAMVDGLAERLGDRAGLVNVRANHEAERRLALLAGLESAGRGGPLLERVRRDFGMTNAFVEVQAPLLNELVGRPINDCGPLTDCILGTSIRGTGATNATLTVSPIPSLGQARLAFRLSGSTRSNTTGVNGPVQIRSLGDTTFSATKIVDLSDESFRLMPAQATATTRTKTQSVSKMGGGLGSRLIERVARQRVAEKKGQADAIASDRAEDRVEDRLNEQLDSQIIDARRRYDERVTRPLRQRRATPRNLAYRTTSEYLAVNAVMANGGELAAWDAPPEGVVAPLSARLHQTAVNNLLDAYLGGATLRRESVDEPTKINIVAPPWLKLKAEPLKPGERFQPWSLKFRDDRPISVELNEGRVKALLHAEQIRVEDKTYDNWDLIATYEPQQIDGVWHLVRQGDVEVLPTRFDPASGGRLTSTEVGLRNNLADALNNPPDRIPQTIKIDPIDLTSREGPVQFLSMTGIEIHDGWVALGWKSL
ncbi:hypothetical protein Pla108_02300 [Botrimarina colliarenosi]|uniref:Secreted protein n=1 Tax=Botrimarina colliarenosi TaxID=2528001 RepID=A0A5C6AJF1_9BACT|nr:hypothetical protein [Botrimarina colliarenosi]TWT99295.1 hypothetical protein Pla108_02300 [Botrimarina colliarenosi]